MDRITGFLGRRNLIKAIGAAGVGYAASVACTSKTSSSSNPVAALPTATNSPTAEVPLAIDKRPEAKDLTPDQALKILMDGNQRFVEGKTAHPRTTKDRVIQTSSGQYPFVSFLGCADSRVPVETVFDQGIGDCFVCRLAGNLATPEAIGSLEFGTLVLGSKVILVLGHQACGAITTAMGRLDEPNIDLKDLGAIPSLVPYLSASVEQIQAKVKKDGVEKHPDEVAETVKANAIIQAAALAKSSILSKLVAQGNLKIIPAYYSISSGTVTLLS